MTIPISRFRQQCLTLLEHLEREGITITKRGRPIARVLPVRRDNSDMVGSLKGKLIMRGNILSTGDRWDAES